MAGRSGRSAGAAASGAPRLPDLPLHEAALLLALEDRSGTTRASMFAYGVAGGILAELMLRDRLALEERRRGKPLVDVASATQTGDPVLDAALERIRTSKRRASLEGWVSRLAHDRNLKHDVARRLVRKGVLRADEDRVLFFFARRVYPEMNPEPERRLIESLRHAILSDDDVADPRTAILAALGWRAGLLGAVAEKKVLRRRKKRLEAIASGDAIAAATRQAIEAVQAAVIAATTAATIAATSAATSAST